MVTGKSDLVTVEVVIMMDHPGKDAIAVDNPDGGGEWIWIPRSQCERVEDSLLMPEWVAMEKGLI